MSLLKQRKDDNVVQCSDWASYLFHHTEQARMEMCSGPNLPYRAYAIDEDTARDGIIRMCNVSLPAQLGSCFM